MEEIVNRVAKSPLITIDLEELRPSGERHIVDLSVWLEQGFILREKEFRQALTEHDWTLYQNTYVAVQCSSEAVLPAWAALLVTTYLSTAKVVVWGDEKDLEKVLYTHSIAAMDISTYAEKPLIIKGCSDPSVPQSAYLDLIHKLQPVAKSIFFGEACSSVPLFKVKK